jgi:hypothetical protein
METIATPNNLFSKTFKNQEKSFFAEVIESNLQAFTAQCWKWDRFAEFGSLVQVESDKNIILGCVIQVQTGSLDPMHSPFPYQKTEAEQLLQCKYLATLIKTKGKWLMSYPQLHAKYILLLKSA